MAKENLSKLDTGVTVDLTIDGEKVRSTDACV